MIEKRAKAWEVFTASLTSQTRQLLLKATSAQPVLVEPAPKESAEEYSLWRQSLTEATREAVDTLLEADVGEELDETSARYCLVECNDGEWASLRVFKDAEALARRLSQLEGKDMVLWPFFGVPLRFTKGPPRYLLLPDGRTGLLIPVYPGGPCKRVDADLLQEQELQEDSYVGPLELAQTGTVTAKLSSGEVAADEDEDEPGEEADLPS